MTFFIHFHRFLLRHSVGCKHHSYFLKWILAFIKITHSSNYTVIHVLFPPLIGVGGCQERGSRRSLFSLFWTSRDARCLPQPAVPSGAGLGLEFLFKLHLQVGRDGLSDQGGQSALYNSIPALSLYSSPSETKVLATSIENNIAWLVLFLWVSGVLIDS